MARISGAVVAVLAICGLGVCLAGRLPNPRVVKPNDWVPPKWCRDLDCPEFEVKDDLGDHVELRRYAPATWVMTNVSDESYTIAYPRAVARLLNYTTGGNLNKTTLNRTTPVLTLFYPTGKGREIDQFYSVESFLPYDQQEEGGPEPASDKVELVDIPEQDVFVKSFGGFVLTEDAIVQMAFDMMDDLLDDGEDVFNEYFAYASYDLPTRLVKRHNEIWIFKDNQK